MNEPSGGRRHAVLIGIDKYPYLPQLEGCVNDSKLIRSVLEQNFDFPPENIVQLLDEQATMEAILNELDQLVERVGEDDVVVIQFAGHGSQMTDREGDEPDGLDETIQPFDTKGWRGEETGDQRDISDDVIHLYLMSLAKKTPFTTLIVDACHSGTITRDPFGVKSRGTPADTRPIEQLPPSPIPPELHHTLRARGGSGWLPLEDSYVLLAGCRDEELSYEYRVDTGADEPVMHGAMTYFLSRELAKATPGTTYRDVFERVQAAVNGNNPRQHPQMEGRLDREIFGVQDVRPMKHARVKTREGKQVTIGAGLAHNTTVGSVFGIYPQGTKRPAEDERLGAIQLVDVGAFESTAEIVEEEAPGTIDRDTRAVEEEHAFGGFVLSVSVGDELGDPEVRSLLEAELVAADNLEAREDGASIRIYLLPPRGKPDDGWAVPQLGALAAPTIGVVDDTGQLVMPPKGLDEVRLVIDNLKKIARYRHLLHLDNPEPGARMRGHFRLELLRHDANRQWVPAEPEGDGGPVIYRAGDAIAFRVSSTYEEPVYVTVFDFGLTGKVTQVFPRKGASQILSPGTLHDSGVHEFQIWTEGKPRRLVIPTEIPPGFSGGLESIKLIVSEAETDLSVLEQSGVRTGEATPSRGLQHLFAAASSGTRMRDVAEHVTDDWLAVTRSFVLRERSDNSLPDVGSLLNLAQVSITLDGVTATVDTSGAADGPTATETSSPDALEVALDQAGFRAAGTVRIEDLEVTGSDRGSIQVRGAASPPGMAQVMLSTDELGVHHWFIPGVDESPSVARGATPVYHIPVGEGRGLPARLAIAALKVLVFPHVEGTAVGAGKAAAEWGEQKLRPYGLRSFTAKDYRDPQGKALDADGWSRLAEGRSLLFVHGTTSQAHAAFGDLGDETMRALEERYEGRLFAFDHPTLSVTPRENVEWLLDQIPPETTLDLDIVCHSRGGLVARVLSERLDATTRDTRPVSVGSIVFVGSPNAGTKMADGTQVGHFLDTYTNLASRIPGSTAVDTMAVVLAVVQHVASRGMTGLPGLQSMHPGGEFQTWLAEGDRVGDTKYFAIASDYEPRGAAMKRLAESQLSHLFEEAHDFVVPVESVYGANGSPHFPLDQYVVLRGDDSMSHVGYFGAHPVQAKLLDWLTG